ncbi:MAG: nucleotidyl transferase AbiEii/AbiGii toxin family protein [Candidatus Ratteibacteria bacterium]
MELKREHKEVVIEIKKVLDEGNFYLAGGTALFYILNHRNSIDLDFFTSEDIDLRQFKSVFEKHELKLISKDTIHASLKGINTSLFIFKYPMLKPLLNFDIIKLASLEDILCMKVNAIIQRGARRDFIDVYFIMKELKLKSDDVIELFEKKFGKHNKLLIKKALTYFEDAEKEPEIKLIRKVEWKDVKKFFIEEFGRV